MISTGLALASARLVQPSRLARNRMAGSLLQDGILIAMSVALMFLPAGVAKWSRAAAERRQDRSRDGQKSPAPEPKRRATPVDRDWSRQLDRFEAALADLLGTPGIRWLVGYERVDPFESVEEERFQTRLADQHLTGSRLTSLTITVQCLLRLTLTDSLSQLEVVYLTYGLCGALFALITTFDKGWIFHVWRAREVCCAHCVRPPAVWYELAAARSLYAGYARGSQPTCRCL